MRANASTTLLGRGGCLLVPYSPEHVPIYHSWMESEELREATASERLTLEEEEEMQRSWSADEAKLTFIICDAGRPGRPPVGDVNLFFRERSPGPSSKDDDGDGDGEETPPKPSTSSSSPSYLHETAEVEVMIADAGSRRKGLAKEAVLLCLWWASVGASTSKKAKPSLSDPTAAILLPRLRLARVKIGRKNKASLALFESIGFVKTGGSDFFEEDHLELELFVSKEKGDGEDGKEEAANPTLIPLLESVGKFVVVGEVERSEEAATTG